jgi:3-carboxy-cis,cis-muconate cycloisomerase
MSLLDALFRYDALDKLFTDEARIQGMLDFEAALARAEAKCGIVPPAQAQFIANKCRAQHFDFAGIAKDAALSGNLAIPLIRKLTELVALENKDAARFVHWGATSQDVIDTGCILQVRGALNLIDQDLARLSGSLIALSEKHRATPVVARTWMQQALPTTFGFIVAGWLDTITRHRKRLAEIKPRVLALQFGGAVGTLAALGGRGPEVARVLAEELGLALPAIPWHTQRDRIVELATSLGMYTGTLGKIARDISLHAQTELAAATRLPGLVATLLFAMPQEEQRGLGGWHAEWETLPDIVYLSGGALHHLAEMLPGLEVDVERMRKNLDITNGLIFAEAVAMALGDRMGKMPAHIVVEAACKKAREQNRHLKDNLREESSLRGHLTAADLENLFDVRNYLGSTDEFIRRVIAEARAVS